MFVGMFSFWWLSYHELHLCWDPISTWGQLKSLWKFGRRTWNWWVGLWQSPAWRLQFWRCSNKHWSLFSSAQILRDSWDGVDKSSQFGQWGAGLAHISKTLNMGIFFLDSGYLCIVNMNQEEREGKDSSEVSTTVHNYDETVSLYCMLMCVCTHVHVCVYTCACVCMCEG